MEKQSNLKVPTTAREKIATAELNKLIRKKQRQDLRNHRTTAIKEVIKQGRGFKMVKRKLNCARFQFTGVLEEDGTVTTDRDRIVERLREFYEKLYSSTRSKSELDTLPPPDNDKEPAASLNAALILKPGRSNW